MAGRGTGQPGGERAADFVAERFAALGLAPLGDAGGYKQPIAFRGEQLTEASALRVDDVALKPGRDFAILPPFGYTKRQVAGDLVFVGYGVDSTELHRNDFLEVDIRGKIAVVLAGMPTGADPAAWSRAISGEARGRNLLGRGAVAVVIVGAGSPEQPFEQLADYWTRRRVELRSEQEPPADLPPIVFVGASAADALFARAGMTATGVQTRAASGAFLSRDLGRRAVLDLQVVRDEGVSSNVVAMLEGSDPALKQEAVVFLAHYDAYGTDAKGTVYPGAADNALGVAELLGVAEALARGPERPRRSIVFLAVTGEEYIGLGSQYWVAHPTWPLERIAAAINFDGIGTEVYGPVKQVVVFGEDYSSLGPVAQRSARDAGIATIPDPTPNERHFFRSDHVFFAQRGIPAVMLQGLPAGEVATSTARAKAWTESDYHKPTDVVRSDWSWEGARDLAVLALVIGLRVAQTESMPGWAPAWRFNRTRGADGPVPQ